MSSAAHPQRDRPGGRRQAARDSQTRTLRRRSFSHFASTFDGAVGARLRQYADRDAANGLQAQSRVCAVTCSIARSMAWLRFPSGVADSLAAAGVDRQRITVVHSGVDCDRFRPPTAQERADARAALGISDGEILISAVGALEQRKGHRYLIEAIGALSANPGKFKCLIAGQGSIREVLQREIAVIRSTDRSQVARQNRRRARTAVGVGHICDAVAEGRSRRGGSGSHGERACR